MPKTTRLDLPKIPVVAQQQPVTTAAIVPGQVAQTVKAPDGFGAPVTPAAPEVTAPIITRPSDYELTPGKAPGAISLPAFLTAAAKTPEGKAMMAKFFDTIQEKTGLKVPQRVRLAAADNAALAPGALEVGPRVLSDGVQAINVAYQAGKIKPVTPRELVLPQQANLDAFDALPFTRKGDDLKPLGAGLFTGDLKSAAPDDVVKRNTVMAEVFQRLSSNASAPPDAKFSVTYGGKSFDTLAGFIGALKGDGYQVEVAFQARIANFAALKMQVPNTNTYVDVPAPLMVRTGVTDALGKEAVVPAAHSEMIVTLTSGPETKGPKIDAELRWYQGVNSTGFFPAQVSAEPEWLGRTIHERLTGDAAVDAVRLAGRFGDAIHVAATKANLYADGYGITGVCNDSVAVIEQAVTGTFHQYPLVMRDSAILPTLLGHLGDPDVTDDADFAKLAKAVREIPSDVRNNTSGAKRALESIPWKSGDEPFASTAEARRILTGG